eukprot:TRINITY_DN3671_c0_g1_i3.p1 TRINITY_DN3671_c0_g1~~TRINITY_DN3671_c0_g1_i3.p1  ORF type:complete len:473 (-),score=86.21 TRINITY_DN3671_c0_g1_i3:44-1462(-)
MGSKLEIDLRRSAEEFIDNLEREYIQRHEDDMEDLLVMVLDEMSLTECVDTLKEKDYSEIEVISEAMKMLLNRNTVSVLFEEGILSSALFDCMEYNDTVTSNMLSVIQKVAGLKFKDEISPYIPMLLSLLIKSNSDIVQVQICNILRVYVIGSQNRKDTFRYAGGVEAMVSLLNHPNDSLVCEAAAALYNSAFKNVDNKNLINEMGSVPLLLDIMKERPGYVKYEASKTIKNLSIPNEIKTRFRKEGGIKILLDAIRVEENSLYQTSYCAALNNLCIKNLKNKIRIGKDNGFFLMAALITDQDVYYTVRSYCVSILSNSCVGSVENKTLIRTSGGIVALLNCIRVDNPIFHKNIISKTCIALRNLCLNVPENSNQVLDLKGIKILCELIRSGEVLTVDMVNDIMKLLSKLLQCCNEEQVLDFHFNLNGIELLKKVRVDYNTGGKVGNWITDCGNTLKTYISLERYMLDFDHI